MIEPRINWLIDLGLGGLRSFVHFRITKAPGVLDQLGFLHERRYRKRRVLQKICRVHLATFWSVNASIVTSDPKTAIELSLSLMRQEFGETVLIDAVLVYAWILYNCSQDRYLSFDECSRNQEGSASI